jgi:hypothetical protein
LKKTIYLDQLDSISNYSNSYIGFSRSITSRNVTYKHLVKTVFRKYLRTCDIGGIQAVLGAAYFAFPTPT